MEVLWAWGIFPGSMVDFALGLNEVAAWHGSLVDYSPRDEFIIAQGPEEHFLPWA